MEFEFDPAKSAANKDKHGIDFVEAQALWADSDAYTSPALPGIEERFMTVGMLEGKLWSAVITMRGPIIRIISVRRSRTGEEAGYERARETKAEADRRGRV